MKAKKSEIPTSSWLILAILFTIFLWGNFNSIHANEVDKVIVKSEDIKSNPTFHNKGFEMDPTTSISLEAEIKAGAHQKDIERQLAEEEAKRQAEEARKQEEARLMAIAAEEARYHPVGVCGYMSSKKTYMDYRAISPYSTQMSIINTLQLNSDGLLVSEDGFIAVALGSTYGPLGSKYRITTDSGNVFKVIKVDEKSDQHTSDGCQDASGALIEFVIDTSLTHDSYPAVTLYGDFNAIYTFYGNIVQIEQYI